MSTIMPDGLTLEIYQIGERIQQTAYLPLLIHEEKPPRVKIRNIGQVYAVFTNNTSRTALVSIRLLPDNLVSTKLRWDKDEYTHLLLPCEKASAIHPLQANPNMLLHCMWATDIFSKLPFNYKSYYGADALIPAVNARIWKEAGKPIEAQIIRQIRNLAKTPKEYESQMLKFWTSIGVYKGQPNFFGEILLLMKS